MANTLEMENRRQPVQFHDSSVGLGLGKPRSQSFLHYGSSQGDLGSVTPPNLLHKTSGRIKWGREIHVGWPEIKGEI